MVKLHIDVLYFKTVGKLNMLMKMNGWVQKGRDHGSIKYRI